MPNDERQRILALAGEVFAPGADVRRLAYLEPALLRYAESEAFHDWEQETPVERALEAVARLRGVDVSAVWKPLWDEHERVGSDGMPEARRVYLLCMWYYYELSNGGLSQWFHNADGDVLMHTSASLRTLGVEAAATEIDERLQLFPNLEIAEDTQRRRTFMRATWDRIENISSENDPWETPVSKVYTNLQGLCLRWLLAHVDDFRDFARNAR